MNFKILGTDAIERLCSPHFSYALGFLKSFQLNSIQLTSNSLLISLISSLFWWISAFFNILQHISGVSSLDFAPEGAGWLHHWTKFQLIFESHCLGHLVPILCPSHLGHLISQGIVSPSFWHLCHLLHPMINWSTLITFLIWVWWIGIGTV